MSEEFQKLLKAKIDQCLVCANIDEEGHCDYDPPIDGTQCEHLVLDFRTISFLNGV